MGASRRGLAGEAGEAGLAAPAGVPAGARGDQLFGRERELEELGALSGGALLLTGEAGAGKTTLLDAAAAAHGALVLRATGVPSEATIPFAALHQLLHPVVGRTEALSRAQQAALSAAMGLTTSPAPPDRLLIGTATLTLLSDLTNEGPVLVVADDAQWIDRDTRDVLSFVARRLDGERLTILAAARDHAAMPDLPARVLHPLDADAAGRLLDAQARPPIGLHRTRILAEAAGNPLALLELARTGLSSTGPLPPTERIERIFAADLDALPEPTRAALLLVAADSSYAVTTHWAADLAAAEAAGLIRVVEGRARFRHPLAASAIYHRAPLDARRAAHRTLAELLAPEPDRQAWHLAAAAGGRDDTVAGLLEDTASRARRRGGYAAAARALERAADLSTAPADAARRLVLAAADAMRSGQAGWVEQLASRAAALTDDRVVLAGAALRVGQVLALTTRHAIAYRSLMQAAAEPTTATEALTSAAVVAFYSGDDEMRGAVSRRAGELPWARAVTAPSLNRRELVDRLPDLVAAAEDDPTQLTNLATMAWLLDETATAVTLLDDALHRWRATGHLPLGLGCSAGWAYLEHGHWAQARLVAADARELGRAAGLQHVAAAAAALEAAVLALQGDTAQARQLAAEALAAVDPQQSRAVAVRARWALGLAAATDGDHETAYVQLRAQFTADGDPVHYVLSDGVLADLAAAAVRVGERDAAIAVLDRAEHRLGTDPSTRQAVLLGRSRALLFPGDAEPVYEALLAYPNGADRPFDHALTLLDHGEWLRRRRRVSESRRQLAEALEIFQRLGSRPWAERALGELRAAGVDAAPAAPNALAGLTPQQQQIVRLAARGLSNRDIGDMLFLSPRTVGSHLYRSYPKLGVTTRAQLRDVVGE